MNDRLLVRPERLLRAQLLHLFYSVRSERMLMEQLDYNILFRWFVGLEMDEPIWAVTVFTKNRDRLMNQAVAQRFFELVVAQAAPKLSDEHFTVDGTLIEAWADHESFQRKDNEPPDQGRDFRGQTRKNDTHASKTDPDARLYRKSDGTEARLAYLGHVLMENRHGLVVQARATHATGTAERVADRLGSWRSRRDASCAHRSRCRRTASRSGSHRVERVFGWIKPIAGMLACAAFNLKRLARLDARAAA